MGGALTRAWENSTPFGEILHRSWSDRFRMTRAWGEAMVTSAAFKRGTDRAAKEREHLTPFGDIHRPEAADEKQYFSDPRRIASLPPSGRAE